MRVEKVRKYRFRSAHCGALVDGKILGGRVACPRVSLLRDHGIEEPPDGRAKKTFALGKLNEDVYAESLALDHVREETKIVNHDHLPDVEMAASADFQIPSLGVVVETKAISSTSQAEKVLINGKYKLENLCQLVFYLYLYGYDKGVLRYDCWVYHTEKEKKDVKYPKKLWKVDTTSFREFHVTFDEDGNVLVDGEKSPISLFSVLRHADLVCSCLQNQEVCATVPVAEEGEFPPCGVKGYECPWKSVCDNCSGQSTEWFVEQCRAKMEVMKNGNV